MLFSAFEPRIVNKTVILFLKARALRLTAKVLADKAAPDSGGSGVGESLKVRADCLSTRSA